MQSAINRGMPSRQVKVNTAKLLTKIKANREQHVTDYNEAVAGYKEEALKRVAACKKHAEQALVNASELAVKRINEMSTADIEDGPGDHVVLLQSVSFHLPVPQNHSAEYDAVISILEMCEDKEFMLATEEHACYVMDDWDWKKEFQMTNRAYGKSGH